MLSRAVGKQPNESGRGVSNLPGTESCQIGGACLAPAGTLEPKGRHESATLPSYRALSHIPPLHNRRCMNLLMKV